MKDAEATSPESTNSRPPRVKLVFSCCVGVVAASLVFWAELRSNRLSQGSVIVAAVLFLYASSELFFIGCGKSILRPGLNFFVVVLATATLIFVLPADLPAQRRSVSTALDWSLLPSPLEREEGRMGFTSTQMIKKAFEERQIPIETIGIESAGNSWLFVTALPSWANFVDVYAYLRLGGGWVLFSKTFLNVNDSESRSIEVNVEGDSINVLHEGRVVIVINSSKATAGPVYYPAVSDAVCPLVPAHMRCSR